MAFQYGIASGNPYDTVTCTSLPGSLQALPQAVQDMGVELLAASQVKLTDRLLGEDHQIGLS